MTAKKKLTPEEEQRRAKQRTATFSRHHANGKHEGNPKDGCPLCHPELAGTDQDTIPSVVPDLPPPPPMPPTGARVESPAALMEPPTQGPTDAMGTPLLPGKVEDRDSVAAASEDVLSRSLDGAAVEKERQHQAALHAAREADAEARTAYPQIGDKDGDIAVHVMEDGFTILGKVWVRGDTIRIKKGSKNDELSRDRTGRPFYEMGEMEQRERYDGRVMFGQGPWPYEKMDPEMRKNDPELAEVMAIEDEDSRERALARLRKKRAREAPVRVGV